MVAFSSTIKLSKVLSSVSSCASYNRKNTPPVALLKVDIQKAYDSVKWEFLKEMLEALNFPHHFTKLIMECVTSLSFTICLNGEKYGYFQGKRGLRQGDPMSPLLFVLCMEYFSRLLKGVGQHSVFQFHHRCKGLKLNHLVFADDLIIFCKGEEESIKLCMRALATFAACSGLVANSGKSDLYFCNNPADVKERVIRTSGFMESSLPFKYLGVSINAKKLAKHDCQMMIDKVVARLRRWGSKSLSYAGRAVLVNSVLLNLHSYWASIFILPRAVLDGTIAICRNFLWDGKAISCRPAPIAWDFICKSKKEGGLGFKESKAWNLAMIGNYVWNVATKADNLWVKWVDHLYIKGRDWWHLHPPSSSSWYWRQICKAKEELKEGFRTGNWVNTGYTAKKAYQWLRGQNTPVEWCNWVWNRLNVPKHSFIAWLMQWGRLSTRDRMVRHGVINTDICPNCQINGETIEHVFFHCSYAMQVWRVFFGATGIQRFSHFSSWIQKPAPGRFKQRVIQAAVVAVLYHLWHQRNNAVWNGKLQRPSVLVGHIRREVYMRIVSIMPRKATRAEKDWFYSVMR